MNAPRTTAFALLMGVLFLVLPPRQAAGQTDPTPGPITALIDAYVQVRLNDGTLKYGRLVDVSEADVMLDILGLGMTEIPKYLVQNIEPVELDTRELAQGYKNVSNQPSRYFFAPSGFQLEQGEGYFQSNIALNSISYGFTDRFTGGLLVSVLGAGLTAKFGGQVAENVHMSFGGLATIDYYGALDRPLVLGFANVTFGDQNKNLTFNVGVGNKFEDGYRYSGITSDSVFVESTWNPPGYWQTEFFASRGHQQYQNPVLLNLSAMLPLTENRWFITENYLVIPTFQREVSEDFVPPVPVYSPNTVIPASAEAQPGGGISLGIRSYNRRTGWLWDYGLAGVFGDGFGFPLPWFSFTLEF